MAFLRKYYMMPLMDLHRSTAPSKQSYERESMLTKAAYEQMLVTHDAVMDQFMARLNQRTLEFQEYCQSVGDREGYQFAETQASQELTPQTPRQTNSYVYDPMMILLYRKPEPTAQPT
ncbi:hypothetical protein INS49_004159 [Diaporthe citri]|uniref:uncharacterized protein n=1 Tax=Diaporthe citri TaxID=83186 RepID=UPI001C80126D|nr:uncharacterized protein INS49_004159 [Diaporthe citri]KAG6355078.1 hypothetical protein INS49_004159 [Diaporthe citri]